jgi:hypothetical protein
VLLGDVRVLRAALELCKADTSSLARFHTPFVNFFFRFEVEAILISPGAWEVRCFTPFWC